MEKKEVVLGLPDSFKGIKATIRESTDDDRILFYLGSNFIERADSIEHAIALSDDIHKMIVCDKEHLLALRSIGIDAYDIETISDLESRSIVLVGEHKPRNMLDFEDILKEHSNVLSHYHNRTRRKQATWIPEDNFYPGMSKKKGGFRHRFVRAK